MSNAIKPVLRHLEDSDSSEAHAIQECISGALEDVSFPAERVDTVKAMLHEFKEWAEAALKLMDDPSPLSAPDGESNADYRRIQRAENGHQE